MFRISCEHLVVLANHLQGDVGAAMQRKWQERAARLTGKSLAIRAPPRAGLKGCPSKDAPPSALPIQHQTAVFSQSQADSQLLATYLANHYPFHRPNREELAAVRTPIPRSFEPHIHPHHSGSLFYATTWAKASKLSKSPKHPDSTMCPACLLPISMGLSSELQAGQLVLVHWEDRWLRSPNQRSEDSRSMGSQPMPNQYSQILAEHPSLPLSAVALGSRWKALESKWQDELGWKASSRVKQGFHSMPSYTAMQKFPTKGCTPRILHFCFSCWHLRYEYAGVEHIVPDDSLDQVSLNLLKRIFNVKPRE